MLQEIIQLREQGLSFRKIAIELDTTVGKVQYQWLKYQKSKTDVKAVSNSTSLAVKTRKRIGKAKVSLPVITKSNPKLNAIMSVLLTSPSRAYCYWNIDPLILSSYKQNGKQSLQYVLKLYDITSILFSGQNAHQTYTIYLRDNQSEWFISGLKGNRTYCAEYGLLEEGSTFYPLIRSNSVHTPRMNHEQNTHSLQDLKTFEQSVQTAPNWVEHVSTYSYYERKGVNGND
ncbi:DUF4912 domain-containing protein [Bacillus sp. 2205SS5-2]|uniref:DUF4912 domain-containing protein n=1 Tax=Bacillus sp. 2205SS5-2 TaxID=3109031 RepID=UPI003005B9A7